MNSLLDVRGESKRPVHIDELRKLSVHVALSVPDATTTVTTTTTGAVDDTGEAGGAGEEKAGAASCAPRQLTFLAKNMEKLFNTVVNVVKSVPQVWEAFAVFQQILHSKGYVTSSSSSSSSTTSSSAPATSIANGSFENRLKDCRVRQFRALITEPGWEKEGAKQIEVARVAGCLVDCHKGNSDARVLYSIKSLLASSLSKIKACFSHCDGSVLLQNESYTRIQQLLVDIEALCL